jgi:predicted AAA+ superfamily ATPase
MSSIYLNKFNYIPINQRGDLRMKRYLSDRLTHRKADTHRKPLIVKGVRQCGKTWLIKEFGAACYEDVAYFNFEENDALGERFERDLDVARIVTELGVLRKKTIQPKKLCSSLMKSNFATEP